MKHCNCIECGSLAERISKLPLDEATKSRVFRGVRLSKKNLEENLLHAFEIVYAKENLS